MDPRRATHDFGRVWRTLMLQVAITSLHVLPILPCIASGTLRRGRQLKPLLEQNLFVVPKKSGEGDQLDDYYDCPYAIYGEDEARAHREDRSSSGNAITVTSTNYGRLGNHFAAIIVNFAVAYCCKSRLLTLPSEDGMMESNIFGNGTRGTVWFDFSSAPDTEAFDPSTCTVDIEWANRKALHVLDLVDEDSESYNPELAHCAKYAPRLIGCEKAYIFPQGLDNICPDKAWAVGSPRRDSGDDETGTLVIHIRSGDIFVDKDPHPGYGQPPLKFYIVVMMSRPWKKIDVVTSAQEERELHPAIPVLQLLNGQGAFGTTEVNIFTDRSLDDDLRSMICADALVTSKSTMFFITAYHSAASTIYTPMTCDSYRQAYLPIDRPGVQVFGISGAENYSPYDRWHNTPEQREEMITHLNISLERC